MDKARNDSLLGEAFEMGARLAESDAEESDRADVELSSNEMI